MRINLKLARTRKRLTQEKAAFLTGVSRVTYNRVENGTSDGTVEFWQAIKRLFPEETIEHLFKKEDE